MAVYQSNINLLNWNKNQFCLYDTNILQVYCYTYSNINQIKKIWRRWITYRAGRDSVLTFLMLIIFYYFYHIYNILFFFAFFIFLCNIAHGSIHYLWLRRIYNFHISFILFLHLLIEMEEITDNVSAPTLQYVCLSIIFSVYLLYIG